MEVKPGEILRMRYLTHSEPDGRTQRGFHPPDNSRLREEKRVFVVLVLGTEPLVINGETNRDGALDPNAALAELGWERQGDDE